MSETGPQIFEHGADVGVRGIGLTLEDAFAYAARAMFSLMLGRPLPKEGGYSLDVQARGFDLESLFVSWLNVLLSVADLNDLILCKFVPRLDGFELTGKIWGVPRSSFLEDLGVEVKGATFAEILVKKTGPLWVAQCIVDV